MLQLFYVLRTISFAQNSKTTIKYMDKLEKKITIAQRQQIEKTRGGTLRFEHQH